MKTWVFSFFFSSSSLWDSKTSPIPSLFAAYCGETFLIFTRTLPPFVDNAPTLKHCRLIRKKARQPLHRGPPHQPNVQRRRDAFPAHEQCQQGGRPGRL